MGRKVIDRLDLIGGAHRGKAGQIEAVDDFAPEPRDEGRSGDVRAGLAVAVGVDEFKRAESR
jgi:hypothetical protein